MNYSKLSIGQMAKLNHVSEQTLRLYHKKGLLVPGYIEQQTGYRFYHIVQSARLDAIQNLKACGMTLEEIYELLQNYNSDLVCEKLNSLQQQGQVQIRLLEKKQRMIQRMLRNHERMQVLSTESKPFFQFWEKRYICRVKTKQQFSQQDAIGYECMIRELQEYIIKHTHEADYFNNVGTIIKKEDVEKGIFSSNEVFFFVDNMEQGSLVEEVPAGMYCCVCSSDFYEEENLARQILEEIKRSNYEIAGDYLCEVLVENPNIEGEIPSVFYQLQIPVKKLINMG